MADSESVEPRGRLRLRSSAGFATIGSALVVVAIVAAVLTGVGTSKSLFDFGSGFAWLSSNENGSVVQANGATGQGTLKLGIDGAAGSRMRVEQRDGHAVVVVDTPDGVRVLYRLDDKSLTSGAGVKVSQKEYVVRGGKRSYLVNDEDGDAKASVVSVDSESLQPNGNKVYFSRTIKVAADDDGRLVVVEESKGTYSVVEGDSAGEAISVGEPGDKFDVSTIGGRPTIVNHARGEVFVFDHGSPAKVAMPPGSGEIVVPKSGEGKVLALLRRDGRSGNLVLVDVEKSEARQFPVPGDASRFQAPLIVPDAVYLVDPGAGEALVIDPADGSIRATAAFGVGKGDNVEAFVKDGYLWINNPNGTKAAVVDRDGRIKNVDKYKKDIPEISPAPAPDPAPAPSPTDTPAAPPVLAPTPDPVATPPPPSGEVPPPVQDLPEPPPGEAPPAVANRPATPAVPTVKALDASAEVSWRPVPGATAYTVLAFAGTSSSELKRVRSDSPDCGAAAQTCTIGGLDNDSPYSFEVFASNGVGDGPSSSRSEVVIPKADVPAAPTTVQATGGNGSITVDFSAGMRQFTEIVEYDVSTQETPTKIKKVSASAGAPFRTVLGAAEGVVNGSPRTVTVVAKNSAGISSKTPATSGSVTPAGPPLSVANLAAQPGPVSATLSWSAANANGSPVTNYKVTWTGNPTGVTLPGSTLTYTASLGAQQSVSFTVVAVNAVGDGPPISSAQVTSYDAVGTRYGGGGPSSTWGGPRAYGGCNWCPWSGGYRVINNCPSQGKNGQAGATWSIHVPQPGRYSLMINIGDNGAWSNGSPGNYVPWAVAGQRIWADEHTPGWNVPGSATVSGSGSVLVESNNDFCSSGGENKWVYFAEVTLQYEGP